MIGKLLCWLGLHRWVVYPSLKYCARCGKRVLFRLATRADVKQGIQWLLTEDGPPDEVKWGEYVLALEEFGKKPDIILTDELWLDEDSEYFYWAEINLPEKG